MRWRIKQWTRRGAIYLWKKHGGEGEVGSARIGLLTETVPAVIVYLHIVCGSSRHIFIQITYGKSSCEKKVEWREGVDERLTEIHA